MTFLQRIICDLVERFIVERKQFHPGENCWYFKGVRDFQKFMFLWLEKHPGFEVGMDRAIKEESIELQKKAEVGAWTTISGIS